MNKDILKKNIEESLETIREQFEIISAYENKIPQIELDIIMSNIQQLYENLMILRKIDPSIVPPNFTSKETPSAKPENEPVALDTQSDPVDEAKEKPPREIKEPLPEPARTTLDLFGGNGTTIADKLKKEDDNSIASRIQKNKTEDLRAIIGINEKFLFISELFDGSMQDYESAITSLSQCHSSDETENIIIELKTRMKWQDNNEIIQQFINLINRRFQ